MRVIGIRSGSTPGWRAVVCLALLIALASCASGPPRRISEPDARIQQLTVHANGSWSVDVRLQNYSTVQTRFDGISLKLTVGEQDAGTLQGQAGVTVPPESADVVTLPHAPSTAAKLALADALAAGRGIGYRIDGEVQAAPDEGRQRTYDIKHDSMLSPVPGLTGVLR